MRLYILLISYILFISCQTKKEAELPVEDQSTSIVEDTVKLVEYSVDSINVGRKGYNKVELSGFRGSEGCFVILKFYTKSSDNQWVLRQQLQKPKQCIDSDMEIADFNNDAYGDVIYGIAYGARSANYMQHLFIYQKDADSLLFLKNSDDYANLLYNQEMDCVDAFHVYGGCATLFLKIKGDSLKRFASIEVFNDELTVAEYDESDQETIIRHETNREFAWTRFSNYKPLKPNEEYDY